MSNTDKNLFKANVSLTVTSRKNENYATDVEVFKTVNDKTFIADSTSKKEDFLTELKSHLEEVWTKANTFFKNREGIFENKEEQENTF